MDYTPEELEDLATMRTLRERLRLCAKAKIAECEAMEAAKNWLDMNRQIKAIMAADKMVIALYSPPPRRRSAKRPRRDEPAPSSPPHFPNREVSAKPTERFDAVESSSLSPATEITAAAAAPDTSPSDDETLIHTALNEKAREAISTMTLRCAEWAGVWPDGALYNPEKGGWRKHTLTSTLTVPLDDNTDFQAWLDGEIFDRCNAIARQAARARGKWFDGTPYGEDVPDYFSKSANYGTGVNCRAGSEQPGPPRLPWWIVRQPPP